MCNNLGPQAAPHLGKPLQPRLSGLIGEGAWGAWQALVESVSRLLFKTFGSSPGITQCTVSSSATIGRGAQPPH